MAEFSVSALSTDSEVDPRPTARPFVARDNLPTRLFNALRNTSGAWAITDQAIVSIGNFATNIFLARTLEPSKYGTFGLLLETILYLNSLQAALVIYPLSVKGAVLDDGLLRRFATLCSYLTMILAIPLGLSVFLTGGIIGSSGLGLWVAGALILWQLQETLRRLLISRLRLKEAILGDALRYLGQVVIVFLFARADMLSIGTAFAAIAIASIASIGLQIIQIGMDRATGADLRAFAAEFWALGRWMLAANLTFLVSTLGLVYLLALAHSTEENGKFQALSNLVRLSHPLMFGIAGVITPAVAKAFSEGGKQMARGVAWRLSMQGLMVLMPFYIVLGLFPEWSIRILYGADTQYTGLGMELRVYLVWYVVLYFASVMGAHLTGLERAEHHFHAQMFHALGAAVIALPMTYYFGLLGMLVGGTLAKVVLVLAIAYYLRRADRAEPPGFEVVQRDPKG